MIAGITPPAAFAQPVPTVDTRPTIDKPADKNDPYGNYDSRRNDPAAKRSLDQKAEKLASRPSAAVQKLRSELGGQGILAIDPMTATPRNVAKLDGFLTGPSSGSATSVALAYVRARPGVFGLGANDLANLSLRKDYVDINGTHHLSFTQSVDGVPVFGNGLKANVSKDGKIINITGSVAPGMTRANMAPAAVTSDRARALSATNVGSTAAPATPRKAPGPAGTMTYSNGDKVTPTAFVTAGGTKRGWQTLVWVNGKLYQQVIDATTGKMLWRQSLTNSDSAEVYDNYPGAPYGGKPVRTNLKPTWLPANSPWLAGNVGHVYADANGNNKADKDEETPPSGKGAYLYPLKTFQVDGSPCDKFTCTWDPKKVGSWRDNLNQGSTQAMYNLGRIHDTFAAAPIGFTREAGNFEAVDGDGVITEAFDRAATNNGNPGILNNADFGTPPDGQSPRMQMFMWGPAGGLPAFGGNDTGLMFHEYSHGLSHRLVTDANGNGALGTPQSGAMGEAWGDWYGADYLNNKGYERDTTKPGELTVAGYLTGGEGIRNQPMDCPVGTTSALCPGTTGAGKGGYTYGDFSRVINRPQVHADGEIWSQTLWQLRTAVGAKKAESLVTRAMELAAERPSFLDMRNAILQADVIQNNGATKAAIWKVFANRGMGFFASTKDGYDTNPVEDFSLPPAKGTPTGTISGTITDQDTKTPAVGVTVGIGGHDSGIPGDYSAKSDATGKYAIKNIYAGTYPLLVAGGGGYDSQSRTGVSVPSRQITVDWALKRNWAAASGGATVSGYSGPDLSGSGCGPQGLIDGMLLTGWGSATTPANGKPTPKYNIIKLPAPVSISELSIDPNATCGDAASAATKDYQVETSADGKTWKAASAGAFGDANRGKLNPVALAAGTEQNVQFVRFTMVNPQVPGDFAQSCATQAYSGCNWLDSSELNIHGTSG